jgi:hypothetical protein
VAKLLDHLLVTTSSLGSKPGIHQLSLMGDISKEVTNTLQPTKKGEKLCSITTYNSRFSFSRKKYASKNYLLGTWQKVKRYDIQKCVFIYIFEKQIFFIFCTFFNGAVLTSI